MSQKQPGCLQALISLLIMIAVPMLMCGGCLIGGGSLVNYTIQENARIEAAKTPAQKAADKAKKEQDDLEGSLRYMGELVMKKALNYPLTAKLPRYPRVSKMGENEYSVTGVVEASNAFGVKERKKWAVVFTRESKNHEWTHGEVGFWDAD